MNRSTNAITARLILVGLVVVILVCPAQAGVILNRASDKALDAVSNDAANNGCDVQLWDYLGPDQKNQNWELVDLKNGFYRIVNLASGLVLDAHSTDVHKNGCKVQLWEWKGELQQQWKLEKVLDGYKIINRASGLVLDAHSTDVMLPHCRLQLWQYVGQPQQIWKIANKATAISREGKSKRLRVLFIIDTNAGGGIATGMKANQKVLRQIIDEVREGREEKFTIDTIEGDSVRPDTILEYYRRLVVEDGDVLFCYYCGHGGWDAKKLNEIDEAGHFLATSGGNLSRAELRKSMLQKQTRAIFLITDCCSNIAGVTPPQRRVPAEWAGFQKLFFGSTGLYDIQAATRAEFGWCGDGGCLFTGILAKHLCEPADSLLFDGVAGFEWYALFKNLRQDTLERFRLNQKVADELGLPRKKQGDDIRDHEAQTPQALYLGHSPPLGR
jgi:hypothetical protein